MYLFVNFSQQSWAKHDCLETAAKNAYVTSHFDKGCFVYYNDKLMEVDMNPLQVIVGRVDGSPIDLPASDLAKFVKIMPGEFKLSKGQLTMKHISKPESKEA